MVERHACDRSVVFFFFWLFVSTVFSRRIVRQSVSHSGISAGFSMMFVYAFAISSSRLLRYFSQKLGTLSLPGEFQLFVLFMALVTSWASIETLGCLSKFYKFPYPPAFSSILHFHYEYCRFPMMLAQNSSTSSRVGGSVTSILFTVKSFGMLKGFVLPKEFSSFLKSSDSLPLCLDLLFKYFLCGCQVCRVLYVITFQHLLLFSFLDPAGLFHLHQDR